ncbi:hypothetical protein [Deminuibacter soli]|uniref:Uncharacterized protein n=1 Tax=Deminuibacter soli TaxID=2291815 RepID=A0A3E1NDI7_9BACT|nr:hypothetical protein [Deminuibacter soli]RFM25828.1 hypothetical protein DXN05_22985 [Deminuibacter soli]
MNIKSLINADLDLLIDYNQAMQLNPTNWDISEYVNWKYDMNAALAFSKFFFPDFLEVDGCIILAFRYNTESFAAWKAHFEGNIPLIEAACNRYEVADYFFNTDIYTDDEHYHRALIAFAHVLKSAWEFGIKNLFPDRIFVFELFENQKETSITFYSQAVSGEIN